MILTGATGFEQQLAPDFSRNFVLAAVFNWQVMMKNEPQELRKLLSRMPDAPVSSNFTARVMQAVELEETRQSRGWNIHAWNWHALLPRLAVTAAVVVFAGFAFRQHEIVHQRAEIAKSVMLVAQVQSVPSVDALKNFDAIRRMSQPVHADEGLLALAPDLK